ncbi:MAG: LacI family DNA-binding transcriptional regulator [Pseudomonadota bacterium]
MRPTTKDLAKAAGVSLATVDRVLNERPGVRRKTIDAVTEAIERIGFVRNLSAANLARGRVYNFEFLLPKTGGEYLSEVEAHIAEAEAALATDGVVVRHRRVLDRNPHAIARILSGVNPSEVSGVALMAAETPEVRDAVMRLSERGVSVVRFGSSLGDESAADFVGSDNRAAGATAGRLMGRFIGAAPGKVLIIAETMNNLDSVERRNGFDGVLGAFHPNLTALPTLETHGDPERARATIKRSFENHQELCGVYIMSAEAADALHAICAYSEPTRQVVIAHERTPTTVAKLIDGSLDAIIAQDPGHLVRSAIRMLKVRCDDRQPLLSQEKIRIEILIRENLASAPPGAAV